MGPRAKFLLIIFIAAFLALIKVVAAQEFLAPEKAFAMQARMIDSQTVAVRYDIAPAYYMYKEQFKFELAGAPFELNAVPLPPGVIKYDPTFDREMPLYFNEVQFGVTLPAWPTGTQTDVFQLLIVSQGCADAGLCYPPMDSALQLAWLDGAYQIVSQHPIVDIDRPLPAPMSMAQAQSAVASQPEPGAWQSALSSSSDTRIAQVLDTGRLWQIVLLFFLLGVLLAFTPCVLPMIPILSALILGQQQPVSKSRGVGLAAAYVLGMSVIYTLLGVAAGLSGAGLAAWLQTPWVLSFFALLLVVFGLAMFDVIRIEMPQAVQTKLSASASRLKGGRWWTAIAMGAISALIVGPCVAAPLAGALLYISQSGDWVFGGLALFALSWGMGLPLLLVGASAGSLLPKAGAWMNGVKAFFGVLLFATAWWMLSPVLAAWIEILGWIMLAALSAVLLGAFERLSPNAGLAAAAGKAAGLVLAVLACIWLIGLASGGQSLLQPLKHLVPSAVSNQTIMPVAQPQFTVVDNLAQLEQAVAQSTSPVMLDFYADWCVSCKEMELFTFSDPTVAQKMNQFTLLKADVTANTVEHRELLRRFNLFGPPGIIFFDAGGRELSDIRVVGFQNATRFGAVLDQVLAQ